MRVDLHTHTNFSDGSLSPQALVEHAASQDVGIIAVTDHDETGGIAPAREHGKRKGVGVIAGVELSIEYPLTGANHLHILGLFIDPDNNALRQALQYLSHERDNRAEKIIRQLNAHGVPLKYDDLKTIIGEGSAGRPHVAQLLIQKRVVHSVKEAFNRFLSKGRPGYVPKIKLNVQEAINAIHEAQGLAIAAHPVSLGYDTYPPLGEEVLKFKRMGLDGIEAYYPSHNRYFTEWLLDFARQHDLVISGGSDFHGEAKKDVEIGRGRGALNIPYSVVEALRQRQIKIFGRNHG